MTGVKREDANRDRRIDDACKTNGDRPRFPFPIAGSRAVTERISGIRVIDIYAGSITPILPYLKGKTKKCLLVTTAKKVDSIPQAASLTGRFQVQGTSARKR